MRREATKNTVKGPLRVIKGQREALNGDGDAFKSENIR